MERVMDGRTREQLHYANQNLQAKFEESQRENRQLRAALAHFETMACAAQRREAKTEEKLRVAVASFRRITQYVPGCMASIVDADEALAAIEKETP